MIIPLDNLNTHDSNVYELTCATIRRAIQITVTGDDDVEKNNKKVVSTALQQILTNKVEYLLEE